jgi:abelson tyrosine-protein kinase 1/abelson tyrosine-protein kinase 2
VLVDNNRRCLVSDFGQSEMRSEAYRLTGTPPPRTSTYSTTLQIIQTFSLLRQMEPFVGKHRK